jgi:hypothetical protein
MKLLKTSIDSITFCTIFKILSTLFRSRSKSVPTVSLESRKEDIRVGGHVLTSLQGILKYSY